MTSAPPTCRWYITVRKQATIQAGVTTAAARARLKVPARPRSSKRFHLSSGEPEQERELLLFQTHEQRHLHGQLERRTNPSARWRMRRATSHRRRTPRSASPPAERSGTQTNEFRTSFFQQEPLQQSNHHKSAARPAGGDPQVQPESFTEA